MQPDFLRIATQQELCASSVIDYAKIRGLQLPIWLKHRGIVVNGRQLALILGTLISSVYAANTGPRIVAIQEQGNSNVSARALLESGSKPNSTKISFILEKKGTQKSYQATIRFGVCEDPGAVAFKLNATRGGKSSTEIPVSYLEFDRPYALVLQATEDPGAPLLACGTYYDPSTRNSR